MAIYELDGQAPEFPADGNYFVADTATVIGKVRLLSSASVWFGAVLRGDNEWIEIGEGSQIQDNATLHTDPGFPLTIGRGCVIGHQVVIHDGTRIGDEVRIDDHATLGKRPMRAANSATTREQELAPLQVGDGCIVGTGVVLYRGATIEGRVLMADLCTVRENVSVGRGTIVGRGVTIDRRTNELVASGTFENSATFGGTLLTSTGYNDAFLVRIAP